MISHRKAGKRSPRASNPLEDVERMAKLVMLEAQMSLTKASRVIGKLIAVSVLGFTLASNCCFSWYLVPVGVITLAMAAGWLDAIGKECRAARFFPYSSLNSVGASLFRWQWVAVWACVFTLTNRVYLNLEGASFTLPERFVKVCMMALVPLALMLLGRALECGSGIQFQRARSDIQRMETLVRQLATTCKSKSSTPAPLIEHEKIPLYKLGSVAKVLHDIVEGYDADAKLKLDLAQNQRSRCKGRLQQVFSLIYAPFRASSSDLFLWESRDVLLYIVPALYLAMVFVGWPLLLSFLGSGVGTFFLPLCVLAPFMMFKSKAGRYAWALQENIRLAQETSILSLAEIRAVASSTPSSLPSLAEIRAAVPPECFERSAVRSLMLVVRDGVMLAIVAILASRFLRVPGVSIEPLSMFDWLGWTAYGFWQGTVATGWWVLAHECGHGGFSSFALLNNSVGFVLHSVLLVPYFSWQYSHGKHHSKTNHLLDGETHVPDLADELSSIGFVQLYHLVGNSAYAAVQLLSHLVFGWPAYLFFYATGSRRLQGKSVPKPATILADHFRPSSMLFPPHWKSRVALSTFGISLVLGGLAWAAWKHGCAAVGMYYFLPYLWVNAWLVLYTWLQHTDPNVPHYGDSDWTWLRGALCTIDRPYGIFDFFHHHIGSTHVCHHLFSTIPCYNATKATQHLRAFLEPRNLYHYDSTFWPLAAWRVASKCHYVDGLDGTQFYKSMSDIKASGKEQEWDPKLWYIHGNAYDLSQFVNKHPGGSLSILSARGRECTALFESYHPWNDNNRKLLAVYGPKPPPCDPFYEEMKVGVRALFPGGAKDTKMRTSTVCCLWALWSILMYLFFVVQTVPACLAAGVLVGLVSTRLSHEGGHFQASSKPWVNRLTLFLGYIPAGPSMCWYYRHVISHHVHTNDDNDVDVRYIGLVDMLPKQLNWLKVMSLPGIFAGAVAEIGVKQMFDILIFRSVAECPVYLSVGCVVPEAIFWLTFHGLFGPSLLGYACMWLTAGAIFVPMSQVAHAILYPDPDRDASWACAQIKSSVNFATRSSFWYHAAFGLTTQVDHHLFPSIGAHCLDDIHDKVVKPVCAKHGVPLYEVSAKTALGALWQRLLNAEPAKVL